MQCPACASVVGPDVAFCGVCGAAVGPQCPRCARQCRTGDRFCALCGAEVALEVSGEGGLSLRRAERKLVSVVFIDMVGFTSLGHNFDPEVVREAMTSFFRALAGVVRGHGGYVEKFIGDAMMSVFGAPVSREDDAERALDAAIEMHRALAETNAEWSDRLGRQIQIRIGVNTGIAVAGPIGEGRATDYGVCGDVVNTAARFESAAEPGQTIVGETTRELGGRAFLYMALPPLTLKGKPDPVPAFRLLGRAEGVTELFTAVPLIGREAELRQVTSAAEHARGGVPAAVAIVGEFGSGKTRFLQEVRGAPDLAGFRWLQPPTDAPAPLSLVRTLARVLAPDVPRPEMARRLLGSDDDLSRGLVAWLLDGEADPDTAVGGLDGGRRAELLAELFGRLIAASPIPTVIALDRAESADAASLALLGRAIGDRPRGQWLLLTTSGVAWVPLWPVEATVTLGELGPEPLRAMLRAALGEAEIDPGTADALVDAANGNPLALTELVWSYQTTGQLPKKRAGGVAATLLALVQSRIDAVDEESKRFLQIGAAIGQAFPLAIAGAVLGQGADTLAAAGRLTRRNILVPAGDGPAGEQVRFAQSVIRDVAYDGLLFAERRRLHAAVAAAYAADGVDDPLLLAHHHGLGEDDAAAVAALYRAAEAHLAAGDAAAALEHLRRALSRLGEARELGGVHRAALLGRVADVQVVQGEAAGAADSYEQAVAALEPGLARAELYRRQALAARQQGQEDLALDALQAARDDVTLAELDGGESVEAIFGALAALAAAAARIQLGAGMSEEATWEARQALEMLSHLNPEVAALPFARRPAAEAHLTLAEALLADGEAARAVEHADAARTAFDDLHDLAGAIRSDLAIARVRLALGATAEARARLEGAAALARRLGDRATCAAAESILGELEVAVA